MTDKVLPEHYRSRSRDRSDQRRPTFQVLNAVQQPKTHSHGKRDHILSHFIAADQLAHPHPHSGEEQNRDLNAYRDQNVYRENRDQIRDSIQSNYSADNNDNQTHYPQSKIIGVHAVGKESCASVVSSYRGPACNFTAFFHQSNNNGNSGGTNNARNRTQSMSPGEVKSSSGRHRSKNQHDVMVVEEPSDLMVWNATKKTSRSNVSLSESEYRNMNALDKIKGTHKKGGKARSSSVPVHNTNQYNNNVNTSEIPRLEGQDSMVFEQDAAERINERIDECIPSMSPIEVSPSISIASTSYSMQISLVAQQLEEIQQAQNEVLKHLGEEITKVTGENERLRQEVDHVRDQNEGLLKVVHDTTDELERMKQIFRIRGMPHQQQQPQEFIQQSTVESPQSIQQQQLQRSNKQHHSQGERTERRDRESINSNSSNKSHSSKKSARGEGGDPVMMSQGVAESPYLKQSDGLSTKPPKAKKSERKSRPSDDDLATLDDQDVAGATDDPCTDDNVSHRSNDSQHKSSKRRSRENGHRHQSQSPREPRHDNNNNGSETHRRSRSRSKEGHRGSSGGRGDKIRTSNCGDEQVDKKRHLNKQVYQDDCNDSIEMRQAEGGCLRVFTCCWSSPTIRSRADDYSVDDIVLREYRE